MCGGFDELAARLPMALAGVGVVLIVTAIMARLFSSPVGYLSGLALATSVFMLESARQAVADMILAVLVVGAIGVFVKLQFAAGSQDSAGPGGERSARADRKWLAAFWALVGLTNLAKGPLFGAVLVLLTCCGWLVLTRQWAALRRLCRPWGIALALALALAWPLAVVVQFPDTWDLWREHLLGRFTGSDLAIYHKPVWHYLTCPPWQWLPWTPLVVLGAMESLPAARSNSRSPQGFVWWWFLGQLALLSCSAGKHHAYLLYALPALAPLAAWGMLRLRGEILAGERKMRWLGRGAMWLAPLLGLAVLLACGLVSLPYRADAGTMAVLLGAASGVCGWSMSRNRPALALGCVLAGLVSGELYALGWIMSYRDPARADREFLRTIERHVGPDDLLYGADPVGTPRFIFYLDRPVEGYFRPHRLPLMPPQRQRVFVLARARWAWHLQRLGDVTQIAQSPRTRKERSPRDRFTLFCIRPRAMVTLSGGSGGEKFGAAGPGEGL
jgi:4-amino-4-deoxy-L-arabinose transferase-like glycosyltransferase